LDAVAVAEVRMLWKLLVGVLAAAVLAESAFIIFGRHPINRFRAVDEDGYLAFDTATDSSVERFE